MTEKKKMVSIRINPAIWRGIKAEASRRGKTLEKFIEAILCLVIKNSREDEDVSKWGKK